jgi:DNA polymerase-3 subunit delta'
MKFSEIPGLSDLKSKLITSVKNGKVPHAALFQGRSGALSLPLALAFSTYLHCENRSDDDSCGTCGACTLNKKFIHPDTHFAYPVGNMKTEMKERDDEKVRVELLKQWRSFLTETPLGAPDDWINFYGGEDKQPIITREEGREIIRALALKPFQSKFKVMIIWQPEMMHPSASNAMLKILEEPPPHTFFMLVSSQAGLLLPTIISRTQIFTVPLTSDEDMVAELQKRGFNDREKIDRVVGLSDGDLARAIKLIAQEEDNRLEKFQTWMRACFRLDPSGIQELSEEFHDSDRMAQRNLLFYGLNILREAMIHLSGASGLNRSRGPELEFVRNFSKVMNVKRIESISVNFNDSVYQLERNGSAKMIFMDLSLRINNIIRQ